MNICSYTFEEYIRLVESFHGHVAPGMVVGGVMVDLALKHLHLPKDGMLDAVCETPTCLPDAIQLLTPCTIGNGWLKIINVGRFAIVLYEKHGSEGIRVFLDSGKIEEWTAIKSWLFKLKPKKEQDFQLLIDQIREAESSIYGIQRVKLASHFLEKRRRGAIGICPLCGEAYPLNDGESCRACQGEVPYIVSQILDDRGVLVKREEGGGSQE